MVYLIHFILIDIWARNGVLHIFWGGRLAGSRFYEEAGQKGGPWIMGPVMANAVRRLETSKIAGFLEKGILCFRKD